MALLCTLSSVSMSPASYGHHSCTQYSRRGLAYVLYKNINSSLELNVNVLLNMPRTLVALAAAFLHCRENFSEELVHIPRSSTSLNSK